MGKLSGVRLKRAIKTYIKTKVEEEGCSVEEAIARAAKLFRAKYAATDYFPRDNELNESIADGSASNGIRDKAALKKEVAQHVLGYTTALITLANDTEGMKKFTDELSLLAGNFENFKNDYKIATGQRDTILSPQEIKNTMEAVKRIVSRLVATQNELNKAV